MKVLNPSEMKEVMTLTWKTTADFFLTQIRFLELERDIALDDEVKGIQYAIDYLKHSLKQGERVANKLMLEKEILGFENAMAAFDAICAQEKVAYDMAIKKKEGKK